jgi:hypothetical protein
MDQVRFETLGSLGVLTLANPPLKRLTSTMRRRLSAGTS